MKLRLKLALGWLPLVVGMVLLIFLSDAISPGPPEPGLRQLTRYRYYTARNPPGRRTGY